MSGHDFESHFESTGSIDTTDDSTMIDKAAIDQLAAIADRYPRKRSALMPMLHFVQSVDGRVSPRGVTVIAEILGITEAQVSGVATFYTMYKRRPAGKHHIGVCTTALCAVMGGDALLDTVAQTLGIAEGETTEDGQFSLERIECNAACDFAPIMMVNWEFMDNMTPDKATKLLDDLAAGREVHSTRGPAITSWADTERVLAGLNDGRADEGPSAGTPSLEGVRLAQHKGWTGVPRVMPVVPDRPVVPEPEAVPAEPEPAPVPAEPEPVPAEPEPVPAEPAESETPAAAPAARPRQRRRIKK